MRIEKLFLCAWLHCYWNFTSECLSDYLTCFFWHSYSLLYWHFYSFVRLHWIHLPYSGLVTKILIDIVFHPTCLRSSVHEVPTNWKQKYLSFLYSFRYWLRHQIINVPNKAVNKGSKWPNSSGCLFFSSNSILRDWDFWCYLTYRRTSISLICTSESNFMGPQWVNIKCCATYPSHLFSLLLAFWVFLKGIPKTLAKMPCALLV